MRPWNWEKSKGTWGELEVRQRGGLEIIYSIHIWKSQKPNIKHGLDLSWFLNFGSFKVQAWCNLSRPMRTCAAHVPAWYLPRLTTQLYLGDRKGVVLWDSEQTELFCFVFVSYTPTAPAFLSHWLCFQIKLLYIGVAFVVFGCCFVFGFSFVLF